MSDTISRADALRELNGACSNWQDDAKVAEIIDALPSAETHEIRTETHGVCLDLISRADAIEAVAKLKHYSIDERNRLREYAPWHGLGARTFVDTLDVYEAWETLPSAEAVQVVRCKDCRWYDNRYGEVCHNPRYGDGWANYSPPYVDEDYWCKDGERKGGEDECV